jgi:hypothetical protein
MAAEARNYLIFETDLFLYRQPDETIDQWFVGGDCAVWVYMRILGVDGIERFMEPLMEDWGWQFAVVVDDIDVTVSVWGWFEIENCWLFGFETRKRRLFQRISTEQRRRAQDIVCSAVEAVLTSDTRFTKYAWYSKNPFDQPKLEF